MEINKNDTKPILQASLDYKHMLESLACILRDEVGPRVLSWRREKQIRLSTKKTNADILTEADTLSEAIIRKYLQETYPSHKISGEEGTDSGSSESTYEWFIDPIDGTIPYSSGGENFSICVGLLQNDVPTLGIIFYPAKNKILRAARGQGAYLNGVKILNTKQKIDLDNAVVALGLRAGSKSDEFIDYYSKPLNRQISSLVFSGSYSTDTLQLIEGGLDSVVLANATPYDVAATIVIAEEAGYAVSSLSGGKIDFHQEIVPVMYSATKELQKELLALFKQKDA